MFKKIFSFLFIITLFSSNVFATGLRITDDDQKAAKKDPEPKNTLYIELKDGIVIAELYPTIAPRHVERIKSLTKDNFYDGIKFHRVINGFMAQTGDPTGTGRGGSSYGRLYAEFNKEHHTRGTLSMARASDPNSANSQFFIVTGDYFPELDGQYTVFGRVIDGMQYVDKIKAGDTAKNGVVENPDVMIKVVTGEMLNNKSLETVKREIKIVNDMQAEKKKEDPNYKEKPVLELLLQTKDIDINEVEEPAPAPVADKTTAPQPTQSQSKDEPKQAVNNKQPQNNAANTQKPANNTANTKQPANNTVNTQNAEQKSGEQIKNDTSNQINDAVKQEIDDLGIDFDENAIPTPYEPQN